jgi:hypothetical protein
MPFDSSSSSFSPGDLKSELDAAAGAVKGGPVDDLDNAGQGAHAPQTPSEAVKGFGAADLDHAGSGAGSSPKLDTDDLLRAGSGAEKTALHGAADHHDLGHDDLDTKHLSFDHHDDPLHANLDHGAGDHLDLGHADAHDVTKGLVHDDHVKGVDHHHDHDHGHNAHAPGHDTFGDHH